MLDLEWKHLRIEERRNDLRTAKIVILLLLIVGGVMLYLVKHILPFILS